MKKGIRLLSVILFGAITLGTSACATLTTGSSQSVTINTEPSGAICTLSRGGSPIAIVNPTPGTVAVSKSMKNIFILCKKDGFQDSPGILEARFQGMTIGNVILGGVIGLAIDAGSGAMAKYDPMLSIILIPQEFRSLAERDTFFDKMKADCIAEISKDQSQISGACNENETDITKRNDCETKRKTLESEKEKRLAEIEQKRAMAKVKTEKSESPATLAKGADSTTENLQEDINLFMSRYRTAYESADTNGLMSLYSKSAVENGKDYADIKLSYERNFRNGRRYTYILKNPEIHKDDKDIVVSGAYRVVRAGETKAAAEGIIKWTLVREGKTLVIVKSEY